MEHDNNGRPVFTFQLLRCQPAHAAGDNMWQVNYRTTSTGYWEELFIRADLPEQAAAEALRIAYFVTLGEKPLT